MNKNIKILFLMILIPCLIHGESFDQQTIDTYTQENLSLLQWRTYKQMGYGALIAATIFGAGYSVLNSNEHFTIINEGLKKVKGLEALANPQKKGNVATAIVSQAATLTYQVAMGLLASGITSFTASIASKNGFLKNAYNDVVAAFSLPDASWYIQHYVPVYSHIKRFKSCAVYFDIHSPFLLDVHNNAVTMRYIESLIQRDFQTRSAAYVQFLQKQAESSVAHAQDLLQYDACLAAYRYRKNSGEFIPEDESLLNKMRELHVMIVQDLEKIMGFIYAQEKYYNRMYNEVEKEFFQEIIGNMKAFDAAVTKLLNGTQFDREQASLQGKGLFTLIHEFDLYFSTIFIS